MTDLLKQIARRTVMPNAAARRKLVVTLEVGDMIGFREHGRRKVWRLGLHELYVLAVRKGVEAEKRAKKEARKAGRI